MLGARRRVICLKIKFLGTNGWYPTHTGNCVCAAISARGKVLVLDAGDGFYKIGEFAKESGADRIDVLLSHLHLDHIAGLHALPKFEHWHKVRIFAQESQIGKLQSFLSHPYTLAYEKNKASVEVLPLKEKNKLPYAVRCLPLVHADPCIGFRIEIDGKKIAYCTDTGECENMVKLARNADVLISECALLPGEKSPANWPHLSPQMAAAVAKKANVKMLVLTHFDAHRYSTLQMRKAAQQAASKIFKNTIAAQDGLEVEF